jgi:ATP-dependent exoDNAse (exonuclease V) beta subunit
LINLLHGSGDEDVDRRAIGDLCRHLAGGAEDELDFSPGRPDRIVFENDKVTLIDYKTGNKSPAYAIQLAEYERTLEQMGYEVENKIIVYINQGIFLEFI